MAEDLPCSLRFEKDKGKAEDRGRLPPFKCPWIVNPARRADCTWQLVAKYVAIKLVVPILKIYFEYFAHLRRSFSKRAS